MISVALVSEDLYDYFQTGCIQLLVVSACLDNLNYSDLILTVWIFSSCEDERTDFT